MAAQSVPVEHIVVDGASTDGTQEVLDRYKGDLAVALSEPDRGIYDAMNKGIALAAGDYVGLLNADDRHAGPDVLAAVIEAFESTGAGAVYGDLVYVDGEDGSRVVRYWRSGGYRRSAFRWGWMPPHPAFFVRREVYREFGDFNLDLGSAADYEIMLRFLYRHRVEACYLPRILVRMATGGVSNRSLGNRLRANRMDKRAWAVNGLRPLPWTFVAKPVRKIGQWIRRPPAS